MSLTGTLESRTILQVIPDLAAGGAERTVLEIAEALISKGARALVASRGGRMVADLEAMGGKLIKMDAASKNPITIRANARKLAALIAKENVDIIHARSRAPAWAAYMAARKTGTPFVTTYHGAYSENFPGKRWYNSVMAKGDRVIANSAWIAEHVRTTYELPAERLVTIPRGVDLLAFDPANVPPLRVETIRQNWGLPANDNRTVLLLPGRLTDWKGQTTAINALGIMEPEERAGLVLVLAGDAQGRDKYVDELQELIAARGVSNSVLMPGHCSDMPAAYLACDIVLAPSKRPEAFGRTAAEGSAMGRCVVASAHGGALETIMDGQTGALVAPGDASALAGAIRALLQMGRGAWENMGAAGASFVRAEFSKGKLQAATLDVYRDVLRIKG